MKFYCYALSIGIGREFIWSKSLTTDAFRRMKQRPCELKTIEDNFFFISFYQKDVRIHLKQNISSAIFFMFNNLCMSSHNNKICQNLIKYFVVFADFAFFLFVQIMWWLRSLCPTWYWFVHQCLVECLLTVNCKLHWCTHFIFVF